MGHRVAIGQDRLHLYTQFGEDSMNNKVTLYKVGDLIYTEKYDKYAIFLGMSQYDGWIRVYLLDTCEKSQVHDYIWEII